MPLNTTPTRTVILTTLAMIAFAGNSLLCRVALKHTSIDAATFTTIRLFSGAITLWIVLRLRGGTQAHAGSWLSALALFIYAAGFSFAYVSLPASTGALLLFGAVQATMILFGVWSGERLHYLQLGGLAIAFGGLFGLLLPGLTAPPWFGSSLMLSAGVAWGVYSLRGKGAGDPLQSTAENFIRTIPITILLSLLFIERISPNPSGMIYAILSGAVTSGVGYAIWYTALPMLRATTAATVQLSVPVLAALGGVIFLGEPWTLRLIFAAAMILGGVAIVIFHKHSADASRQNAAGEPISPLNRN
jgi:drug/metabolite transporter (DMT)-like permease